MSVLHGLLLPILVWPSLAQLNAQEDQPVPGVERRLEAALKLWKDAEPSSRHRGLLRLKQLGPRAGSAVPALIPGLSDPDPQIRKATAQILRAIGQPAQAAAPFLVKALEDSERDVRGAAAGALHILVADPKSAIPPLVAMVRSERSMHCYAAVYALSNIGEPALPSLLSLFKETDASKHFMIAMALRDMRLKAKAAVPELIEALHRPDRDDRRLVVFILGGEVGPSAVDLLIVALHDRDPMVRGGAARALELIGSKAKAAAPALIAALTAGEPADDPGPSIASSGLPEDPFAPEPQPTAYYAALKAIGAATVPALLEQFAGPDPKSRETAARALAFLGPAAKPAVPRLVASLDDPDRRFDAAWALGGIGPLARASIGPLIVGLKDPDPAFRARSAQTLGRIDRAQSPPRYHYENVGQRAVEPLTAALADPDARVREASATALCSIGREASVAIPDLARLLGDPSADVRAAVLEGLPRFHGIPASERETVARLLADPNRRVRLAAADAFQDEDMTNLAVVSGLITVLKDSDTEVRARAALVLALTNSRDGMTLDDRSTYTGRADPAVLAKMPGACFALQAALSDSDRRVRAASAYVLPIFKSEAKSTIPLMIPLLKDPVQFVRIAAAEGLRQFGPEAREAVPDLLEAAASSEADCCISSFPVWEKSAEALKAISPDAFAKRVDYLLARLSNPSPDVRKRARWTLYHLQSDLEAANRVYQTLADPKTLRSLRIELLHAIVGKAWDDNYFEPAEGIPVEAGEAKPALIQLAKDVDPEVRENARKVLGSIEDSEFAAEAEELTILEAVREGEIDCWGIEEKVEAIGTSCVGMLIDGLKDPDADVRTAAAYGLAALADLLPLADDGGDILASKDGKKPDPEEARTRAEGLIQCDQAVAALIPLLKDPDTQARWAASWALRGLGPGSKRKQEVIGALITMLEDRSSRMRKAGVVYFAAWLNDVGGPSNCGRIGNGDKLRIAAIQALAAFGPDAAVAVPELIDAAFDLDTTTREFAVGAFGAIGPAAAPAVPLLIEILKSKDDFPHPAVCILMGLSPIPTTGSRIGLRARAVQSLKAIGPGAATAVPELARLATNEPDGPLALYAIEALGSIGEPSVAALIPLVRSGAYETSIEAMDALREIGPKAASAIPVLRQLLSDPDEEIRSAAAWTLAEAGSGPEGDSALADLLKALKDQDDQVRQSAAHALGSIGVRPDQVLPTLILTLSDPVEEVVESASSSLKWIGLPAMPALLNALRSESKKLRDTVVETLSEIARAKDYPRREDTDELAIARAKAARVFLLDALQNPDQRVREGAERALGRVGTEGVSELITALGQTSPSVWRHAARALQLIGSEAADARDALQKLRGDSDPEVSAAADAAIKAIDSSKPN